MEKEVDGVVEAKSILTSVKVKKERATDLSIIVRIIKDNPCYEVKYRNVGESDYRIGYSSYNLKTVLEFIDEYFEIVESDSHTNADKIRNMSDEDLAEFITIFYKLCLAWTGESDCSYYKSYEDCNARVKDWLQSEAE